MCMQVYLKLTILLYLQLFVIVYMNKKSYGIAGVICGFISIFFVWAWLSIRYFATLSLWYAIPIAAIGLWFSRKGEKNLRLIGYILNIIAILAVIIIPNMMVRIA